MSLWDAMELLSQRTVAAGKLGRRWVGIDLSPIANTPLRQRLFKEVGLGSGGNSTLGWRGEVTHRTDIPQRTDIDAPIPYRQNKHILFGQQEGLCNGCRGDFPFRNFTIDLLSRSRGEGLIT